MGGWRTATISAVPFYLIISLTVLMCACLIALVAVYPPQSHLPVPPIPHFAQRAIRKRPQEEDCLNQWRALLSVENVTSEELSLEVFLKSYIFLDGRWEVWPGEFQKFLACLIYLNKNSNLKELRKLVKKCPEILITKWNNEVTTDCAVKLKDKISEALIDDPRSLVKIEALFLLQFEPSSFYREVKNTVINRLKNFSKIFKVGNVKALIRHDPLTWSFGLSDQLKSCKKIENAERNAKLESLGTTNLPSVLLNEALWDDNNIILPLSVFQLLNDTLDRTPLVDAFVTFPLLRPKMCRPNNRPLSQLGCEVKIYRYLSEVDGGKFNFGGYFLYRAISTYSTGDLPPRSPHIFQRPATYSDAVFRDCIDGYVFR